jgi:hypothetical protein
MDYYGVEKQAMLEYVHTFINILKSFFEIS